MDDPQLQAILEQFTPEYQAVITSPVAELLAQSFAETFQLSKKEQTVLENSFRLYLMGIHSTEEWVDFVADFTSFDKQTAQIVVDEMQTHIADDIKLQIEELRTGANTQSNQVETAQDPQPTPVTPAPTPQTAPQSHAPAAGLSSIRTMQSDATAKQTTPANATPGTAEQQPPQAAAAQTKQQPTSPATPPATESATHSTISQEDLLQKRKPVNPIPPPPAPAEKSTPPRWESERSSE